MLKTYLLALLSLSVSLVGCIDAERIVASGAGDSSAAVPPANYRSAFEGFIASKDEPLASWPAVNEQMRTSGGRMESDEDPHAAHRSGSAAPKEAPPAPADGAGHKH